jgi:hypothetical protein
MNAQLPRHIKSNPSRFWRGRTGPVGVPDLGVGAQRQQAAGPFASKAVRPPVRRGSSCATSIVSFAYVAWDFGEPETVPQTSAQAGKEQAGQAQAGPARTPTVTRGWGAAESGVVYSRAFEGQRNGYSASCHVHADGGGYPERLWSIAHRP